MPVRFRLSVYSNLARSLRMELNDLLVLKRNINKADFDPCIYFLFKGNEVVYVSQSKNGIARVMSHSLESDNGARKAFDGYAMVHCEIDQLNDMEALNIIKHKPKYNKEMPKSDKVINLNLYVDRDIMLKMIDLGCDFIKIRGFNYIALVDFEPYYQKATENHQGDEKINRLEHILKAVR